MLALTACQLMGHLRTREARELSFPGVPSSCASFIARLSWFAEDTCSAWGYPTTPAVMDTAQQQPRHMPLLSLVGDLCRCWCSQDPRQATPQTIFTHHNHTQPPWRTPRRLTAKLKLRAAGSAVSEMRISCRPSLPASTASTSPCSTSSRPQKNSWASCSSSSAGQGRILLLPSCEPGPWVRLTISLRCESCKAKRLAGAFSRRCTAVRMQCECITDSSVYTPAGRCLQRLPYEHP